MKYVYTGVLPPPVQLSGSACSSISYSSDSDAESELRPASLNPIHPNDPGALSGFVLPQTQLSLSLAAVQINYTLDNVIINKRRLFKGLPEPLPKSGLEKILDVQTSSAEMPESLSGVSRVGDDLAAEQAPRLATASSLSQSGNRSYY